MRALIARGLYADELMLNAKRDAGLVRTEEISLKVLVADPQYQARVEMDVAHVSVLEKVLIDGFPLSPVVAWELTDGGLILVDGFHRRDAYRRHGLGGIPAIVVKGTSQEALEYAAAVNQRASLRRTKADMRKAVRILLDNGWFGRADAWIAKHVGCSVATVTRLRAEYASENRLAMPAYLEDERGTLRSKAKPGVPRRRADGSTAVAYNGNTYHSVGAFQDSKAKIDEAAAILSNPARLVDRLSKALIPCNATYSISAPIYSTGTVAFTVMTEARGNAVHYHPAIISAIGRAVVAMKFFEIDRAAVLVPEMFERYEALKAIASRLNIEFMTLDDFIARESVQ